MRNLTNNEINYICKDLHTLFPNSLPSEMKLSFIQNIINNVKSTLAKELVHDDFKNIKTIKKDIEKHIAKSIISPGESVGVISAQSIGERQTQLCIGYNQTIDFYIYNNVHKHFKIGSFIDNYMNCYLHKVQSINTSQFLNIEFLNYKIPIITDSGHIKFEKIVEISRHSPNGSLIQIETFNGRSILSTQSHVFLIKNGSEIKNIKASELKINDQIPLLINIPHSIYFFSNFLYYFKTLQWDKIKKISIISENDYPYKYVYDISVKNNQTFRLSNGIFIHNTLNSFHQSGLTVATVVTGVPRFLELLNATKEPKMSSNSFIINKKLNTPLDCRYTIKDSLIFYKFNDLVIKQKIFLNEKSDEYWYIPYETIYNNQFRYYNSGITFYLDIDKLYQNKILISKIKNKIENIYSDVCCVISPIHVGQIDLFVDVSEIKLPNDDNLPAFLKNKDPVEIYLEEVVLSRILEIDICGILNISNYYLKKEDEKWKVETEGSNLLDVLSLPFIDISSVSSNNMWEVYNVMGIEAARQFLIDEFINIVSSDGTFINPSHILLLVDMMTYQGSINSISRYGMKKEQMGVLSRSSFEESLDQFCTAGFYAEKEPINAVSANIMCGKRSKIGSGLCTLKIDWNKIKKKI
jgi:DNA-directed RNA polymerase beta' subunit